MNVKPNHLGTYQTLFLVKGILTLGASLFPLIYLIIGIFAYSELDKIPNLEINPAIIFIFLGTLGTIMFITIGVLNLMVSKYLKTHTHYRFIFVVAIISCITGILGTLLCIFSLIELSKPQVKQLFESEDEKPIYSNFDNTTM